MHKFAWLRQPRTGASNPMYHTRHAHPPLEPGWVDKVDIEDAETKRLIGGFNGLVHKHQIAPAQTMPGELRRAKMAALQEEAWTELGIGDVKEFMKSTVWPFVRLGGDLRLVGFHYFDDFVPPDVPHAAVEAAVFPPGYAWEDSDMKHQQNREVCTHGATLLDREQLRPAECESLPLPDLVARRLVPGLRRHLASLSLPEEMDFLYANRYRKAKGGYIRFHHDQLTSSKKLPVFSLCFWPASQLEGVVRHHE